MESLADTKWVIFAEIAADDPAIRKSFLGRYTAQADRFAELMAVSTMAWRDLAVRSDQHDKLVYVVNVVSSTLTAAVS